MHVCTSRGAAIMMMVKVVAIAACCAGGGAVGPLFLPWHVCPASECRVQIAHDWFGLFLFLSSS